MLSKVPEPGRLLVATPVIGDPNFDRTVVLLLDASEQGALGVVLNRPSDLAVLEPLPEWQDLAVQPAVVFVGGPVEPNAAIALARVGGDPDLDGFVPVLGPIGTLDLRRAPTELAGEVDQVRIFAGYAGWGAGQLEEELRSDAWLVVDARPDDALSTDPEHLWGEVLRRQGGLAALLSAYPPDPEQN